MTLPKSPELEDVFHQAEDIARETGGPMTSGHLLLALFTVSNKAAVFLTDRNITLDELLGHLEATDGDESDGVFEAMVTRGERIARGSSAEQLNSLHMLAALVRETDSHGHELLVRSSADVAAVRATVMSYATGALSLPTGDEESRADTNRSRRSQPRRPDSDDGAEEDAPSPISIHPSLGSSSGSDAADRGGSGRTGNEPDFSEPAADSPSFDRESSDPSPGRPERSSSLRAESSRSRSTGWDTAVETKAPGDGDETSSDHETPDDEPAFERGDSSDDAPAFDRDTSRRNARSQDPSIRRSSTPEDGSPTGDATADDDATGEAPADGVDPRYEQEAKGTAESLGDRLFDDDRPGDDGESDEATTDESVESDDSADNLLAREPSPADQAHEDEADTDDHADAGLDLAGGRATTIPPSEKTRETRTEGWDRDLIESYRLDEEECPHLSELGRNLTREAAEGGIDRIVGRDDEITKLIDIVGKRRANNPILIGEPGVGKTAIVEGLARQFVEMGADGNALGQRAIIELELGRVLSGTQLRGALSERLMGIKEEVEAAEGDIIVFLDEIHGWIEAGGSDGSDATGELKTAMARGRFPCIGATTNDEFREFIESDAAFERRFQTVLVEEPDTPTAIEITEGIQPHYEDHHGVDYTDEALEASVRMSRRYIHDRRLPDKAISVMDLAGSRAARRGTDEVGRRQIAEVVAESAGLPVDRLTQDDRQRFLEIEDYLRDEIVGQRHVIDTASEVLRRNYAGFRGNRPIGSLLFLGPTGVGKTETVKVLADFLFHDRDAVVQIDMSEYMKSHSVSRFVGAPPGYVGHGQGGQLTEAIRRRPYQIVLLDELEKAHPEVLNVLLQVFEEGTLTDGKGRTVDFSNALIVMTSNLGSETFIDNDEASQAGPIGFGNREVTAERSRNDTAEHDEVLEAARDHLTPELWNRIDETLVFSPLSRDEIADIAQLQLQDSAERIRDESGIDMEYDSGVIDHLIENGGYDRELGARPMRQTIQRLVEGKVAREILRGEADRGDTVRVVRRDGELCCE